ncbi:MAG: hypothetical protein SFV15_04585 [Polyangiaceae bacterium]|nr:hypothetical protein [Polyangiaceae bacterium]
MQLSVNTIRRDNSARGASVSTRQQVLVLYLSHPALDSRVVAWSFYDGTGKYRREAFGPELEPPYANGIQALEDGWRLIQYPRLENPAPGREYEVGYFQSEFVFEKVLEMSGSAQPADSREIA